jgi:hypothetical protein
MTSRGTELVGHVGEELGFLPACFLELATLLRDLAEKSFTMVRAD